MIVWLAKRLSNVRESIVSDKVHLVGYYFQTDSEMVDREVGFHGAVLKVPRTPVRTKHSVEKFEFEKKVRPSTSSTQCCCSDSGSFVEARI
jgi:hypothetical protein